jgi:hypothetical protein
LYSYSHFCSYFCLILWSWRVGLSSTSRHKRHRHSVMLTWKAVWKLPSLRWKEHFPYLLRFCWTRGNSPELTETESAIENAHFLAPVWLHKSFNEHGMWKRTNCTNF